MRFAPSPTGYLHVGGARTAIFNWLFARHHSGTFILRIEDTDLERSSEPLVQAILDGMAWLGLTADEGPFFQTHSRERHVADAARLLASGHAYRCFCSAESIRVEREAAEREHGTWIYPRRCRTRSASVVADRLATGEPFAVRLAVPDGPLAWDDAVHGPTSFDGSLIEDLVVLRSDGTPTYNLSVVSDDVAMEITHVIRGDDHLSNTPKQLAIYRGLDVAPPTFAHLPLILGHDKKRLSKRHGATSVLEYRDRGYLPDAMFNFLALLGWSPGDDRQKMSREEIVAAFDWAGVGRSGAVFDLEKLSWLNGQYLAELAVDTIEGDLQARLRERGLWHDSLGRERRDWLRRVVVLLRPRARTLDALVEEGRPFFDPSPALALDPAAAGKHLGEPGLADHLVALRDAWAGSTWEPAALEAILRGTAQARGIAAGKLIHPVRLAITGRGASPGLFEVLDLLGRELALARVDHLIGQLQRSTTDSATH